MQGKGELLLCVQALTGVILAGGCRAPVLPVDTGCPSHSENYSAVWPSLFRLCVR